MCNRLWERNPLGGGGVLGWGSYCVGTYSGNFKKKFDIMVGGV
jgi:hypothetical protein